MIKFTAIMPVYNSENNIDRSIGSILKQTYCNWELIIVDDGSTDRSYDICKKYADIDKRIKVYTKKNEGPGKARNYGISKSTGDYISFIDSDDFFDIDYFRFLEEYIRKNNLDLVYFNVVMEDNNGKIIKVNNPKKYEKLNKDDLIKSQIMGIISWAAWFKVAKADIIKKYKFSDLSVGEEAVFSFNVLCNSNKIGFIDKNLYHYVYNEEGQHKKGGVDPWRNVAIELKKELNKQSKFQQYEYAINGLAFRGLSIAIKRVCCDNKYKIAKKEIKQYINDYSKEFDIYKVEKNLLDKISKIIMTFIQLKLYFAIYIATRLKYKNK